MNTFEQVRRCENICPFIIANDRITGEAYEEAYDRSNICLCSTRKQIPRASQMFCEVSADNPSHTGCAKSWRRVQQFIGFHDATRASVLTLPRRSNMSGASRNRDKGCLLNALSGKRIPFGGASFDKVRTNSARPL